MRLHVHDHTCPCTALSAALLNSPVQPLTAAPQDKVFSLCCPVNDKSCLETAQSCRWLRIAYIFTANLGLPFPLPAVHLHIQVKAVDKPRNTTSLYALDTAANQPTNQNRLTYMPCAMSRVVLFSKLRQYNRSAFLRVCLRFSCKSWQKVRRM
jgi:hypothetical protein